MNTKKEKRDSTSIVMTTFKVLIIIHVVTLIGFTILTFISLMLDYYFGFLFTSVNKMIFISLFIGIITVCYDKIISFVIYLFATFIIFFVGFLTIGSALLDMPAYLNDDFEYVSGEITDVKFEYAKSVGDIVKYIYIDGEKYKMGMYTVSEELFEEEYGLHNNVSITYLKHSKQIVRE